MKKIAGIPLLYEPGTKWSYSVAVDIQGYLVQKLSGQKFGDYLKAHVTGPIGMTDTAFYVTPNRKARFTEVYHWDRTQNKLVMNPAAADRGGLQRSESASNPAAAGSSRSTHDYARFCQMMLNKGTLGGKQVLKAETVELMTQNHIGPLTVAVDGTTAQPGRRRCASASTSRCTPIRSRQSLPYGVGTYYWGGAAGTWFWIDPVNDLAFVGMIQMQGGNRPGGMNFRADSARLVYAALSPSTKTSAGIQ